MDRKDFLPPPQKNKQPPLQQHYKSSVSVWPFEEVTRAKNKGKIPAQQPVSGAIAITYAGAGYFWLFQSLVWGLKPEVNKLNLRRFCEALPLAYMKRLRWPKQPLCYSVGCPLSPIGCMAGLGPNEGGSWASAGAPLLSWASCMPDVGSRCSPSVWPWCTSGTGRQLWAVWKVMEAKERAALPERVMK